MKIFLTFSYNYLKGRINVWWHLFLILLMLCLYWCYLCAEMKWKIERVCNYSRRISRWRCNPVVKQKRKVNSEIKDSFSDRKHLLPTLDQNMNTFTYLYHCIAIPNSRHLTSVSIFSVWNYSFLLCFFYLTHLLMQINIQEEQQKLHRVLVAPCSCGVACRVGGSSLCNFTHSSVLGQDTKPMADLFGVCDLINEHLHFICFVELSVP